MHVDTPFPALAREDAFANDALTDQAKRLRRRIINAIPAKPIINPMYSEWLASVTR